MKLKNKFLIIFIVFLLFAFNMQVFASEEKIENMTWGDSTSFEYEDPENPKNKKDNKIKVSATSGYEVTVDELIEKYGSDTVSIGIDVSKWQGQIDWEKVKESGINYVMIRCGYRGFGTEGTLVKDTYFENNIEGALENDIEVGVYFFSAAINEKEAIEEAKFTLEMCKDYDFNLPIVYDFEYFGEIYNPDTGNPYRTNGLTNKQINKNAQAFLKYIREHSNYKTMLYGSSHYLKTVWDTETYLDDNDIWLAHYPSKISSNKSSYTGEYQMWQCTDAGIVPGISVAVDMNFDYTYYPFLNNKTIFLDVESDAWYYNPIKYCKDNKIILGYGETREYFKPDEKITRGMFVTILYRMAGSPEIDESLAKNFPDVKENMYYTQAVKWASSIGIVNGFEDGTFGPDKNILRQDLVIMFRQYVNKILLKNVDVTNEEYILEFDDYTDVENYALTAVKWAVENKVITGKNDLGKTYIDPKGTATRAETASIIRKYIINSREIKYNGDFEIKGKLSIPKIGLETDVLETATASSLELTPGILTITQAMSILKKIEGLNECGSNVVIVGHNYLNEEAFSRLDELLVGDTINVLDQDGNNIEYMVYNTYYTTETDVSYIQRELDINKREISLTTISDDGEQRLVILARD